MLRQTLSALLLAVLALGTLAACGGGGREVADAADPETGEAAFATTALDTLVVDTLSSRVRWTAPGLADVAFRRFRGVALLEDTVVTSLRLLFDAGSAYQDGIVVTRVDVAGPAYLDAARFPEIAFASTRIGRDSTGGSSTGLLEGTLTMRGQARPVSFPASLRLTGDRSDAGRSLGVTATFDLDPAPWDSAGTSRIRGPVTVRVNLVARKRGAEAPGAAIRSARRYQDSLAAAPPAPAQ